MDKILKLAKTWLPLAILISVIGYAYSAGWHEALSLESLQEQKEGFQAYTAENPLLAGLAFAGAYTAAVALSLPIATLLTLLGGFLFGKWVGTLLVVSGATIGAAIIFSVAKTSLGETLRNKAGGLYDKVSKNMEENALGYLFFMRLVPVFPFVLVNILPALFNVKLRIFVLTTFLGILPGTFVYVNLGQTLGDINSLGDLVSTQTILSFALLGLFALIPTLYKQFKNRKAGKAAAAFLLPALAIGAMAAPAQAAGYSDFLSAYDGLLKAHMRESSHKGITYNGVDYKAWANDARHAQAKQALLAVDPADFKTKDDKLAYWINTYNFLTIDLITSEDEDKSIKNLGSVLASPWKKHKWTIAGEDYSLDAIEHKTIRPLGEPRIHFAINCAALSCPDLRAEAYRAGKLDKQLNEQTVLSFNNPSKGYVYDAKSNTAKLSKVMDWFGEDFNDGDVKGWAQAYKPDDINENTKIRYLSYDWSLNRVRCEHCDD